MNISEIYNKFKRGDSLTTEELTALSEHMKNTTMYLRELGQEFHLAWGECLRTYQRCEDYLTARATK